LRHTDGYSQAGTGAGQRERDIHAGDLILGYMRIDDSLRKAPGFDNNLVVSRADSVKSVVARGLRRIGPIEVGLQIMESDLGASYHRSGLVGYGALNAAVELRVAPGQRQRQQDE
jgi:hypothetical protein